MKIRLTKHATSRGWLLTGSALLAGGSLALYAPAQGNAPAATNPKLTLQVDEAPLVRNAAGGYAPVVQKVTPSVVRIAVTIEGHRGQLSQAERDFFRRFFGGHGPLFPEFPGPAEREHGLGSGVIVSADGYIVTNNHVVQNARDIQVTLHDGRTLPAKVIGTDPKTDVALIKVNAQNLPYLTLADSDKVQVGDIVLAIGNPFGIGETVTRGIVSAKNRVTSGEMDEDFIQTDAAINPGNSGGALVDTEGRLVGINAEILSRSGGNQGIGFAVPTNLVRWVTDSLVKHGGRVERGLLGVTIQDLTPGLSQALKLNRTSGALISDVTPSGPAQAAGIKSGDVILKFNNQPVEDANQLKLRVAETAPGTTVPVEVDRNGQAKTFNVTLQEMSGNRLADNDTQGAPSGSGQNESLTGVTVTNLDSQARSQYQVPDSVQGALVSEVDPNSAAYEAGLRPGDVITEINHHAVRVAADAVNLTQNTPKGETLVKVWSQGGARYVAVPTGSSGQS
ncbi:MAG: DegQ family serine endoprotease [Verrucomicrobia bacterium]|nr:DegQ family serine endoprotease [Verrucomicrobiota bacterium]